MKKKFILIALTIIMVLTTAPFMSSSPFAKVSKGTYYDTHGAIISKLGRLIKGPNLECKSYDSVSYENGKYIVHKIDFSEAALYTKNGKKLLSEKKCVDIRYLGYDMFAIYTEKGSSVMNGNGNLRGGGLTLYNAKTKKKTKISAYQKHTSSLLPFAKNGIAMIENEAFYVWEPHFYYAFINKKGKLLRKEIMYKFASGFLPNGYCYLVNDYDGPTVPLYLMKMNSSFNIVKKIRIDAYSVNMVKYKGKFCFKFFAHDKKKYVLYSQELKRISLSSSKIELLAPCRMAKVPKDNKTSPPANEKQLYAKYISITPFTTEDTCLDVASSSTASSGVFVNLYKKKEPNYMSERPEEGLYNQIFVLEKVKSNKYRIWACHSRKQLMSYTDKNKWTTLQQGVSSNKTNQVFTIKKNENGSYYIIDHKGRYLTMAYGSTEPGTNLPFAPFANGDSKQQFKIIF